MNAQNNDMIGRRAPELDVKRWIQPAKNSKLYRLGSDEGRVRVVHFFQADDETHGLDTVAKVANRFRFEDDVVFVAVQSVLDPESSLTDADAESLAQSLGVRFPLAHDPVRGKKGSGCGTKFRFSAKSWTVVIDRERIVSYAGSGMGLDELSRAIDHLLVEPSRMAS